MIKFKEAGAQIKESMTKPKESQSQQRRCIVTGQNHDKTDLVRFVLGPDNTVVPDIKANLPGRGVWVSAEEAKIKEAVERKLFHRGFAKSVNASTEMAQLVEDLLKNAALGRLKMAKKAGQVVNGFTKLMSALEKETIIALVHAHNASPAESSKLDYKFRTNLEQKSILAPNSDKKPFNGFKTQELSLAFGAANVIHAGLIEGGAANAAIKAMLKHRSYSL